jgi:hypothetical protein
MKRELIAFFCGLLTAALTGFGFSAYPVRPALLSSAQAQEVPKRGRACAPGILQGTYSLKFEGEIVSGGAQGLYAAIGVLTFDGQGGLILLTTQNYNGTLLAPQTASGRYTLGDDCAGGVVLNTGARFDLVTDNGGRQIDLLQTNPGNVITGLARKQ